MNNKKIELEEVKKIELDLLISFDEVCKQENLRYSLTGGTLIGAVRHKGFIPWDDDIDVCMPRKDYNLFIEYCKENTTFFGLCCSETDKEYGKTFAKCFDKRTILNEYNCNRWNCNLGIYIDVFPIDGMGNTYEESIRRYNKKQFLREIIVASAWKKYFRSSTKSIIYEPIRLLFFIISRCMNHNKCIQKFTDFYSQMSCDDVKYSSNVSGAYRKKEICESSIFTEYSICEFEGHFFNCFKEWDKFLTHIYGDYMKLPPIEKQISHHNFDAYWKYE